MQINQKGISVVIPNYNGRLLLEKNLPFVYAALKASGCRYEIIVSDDASADDSVAFLRQYYPDVNIIQNKTNGGFSANINKGIYAASLNLLLLLNSDIELSADYFHSQLRYFDKADTFGIMGKVLEEGTGALAEACKYPLSSAFKINHFKNVDIEGDEIFTFYLSGANALVDREKLIILGGFNEIFSPFYHEDLDLSLRAWESGWKCYYDSRAVCKHAVSTTIRLHNSKTRIKTISTRNRMLLHEFHLTGTRLYLWHLVTALSLLAKWLTGRIYYYNAYNQFLQKLPQMRAYQRLFMTNTLRNQQFIPYIAVKKMIRSALDKYIK